MQGVTCSDCHEPHSLQLRAEGNGVCYQCHEQAKYAAASHHRHAEGSPATGCPVCHMPARTYMVVDRRHAGSAAGAYVPAAQLAPVLGDPLTLVAGALLTAFVHLVLLVAVGKAARYLFVLFILT